MNLKQYQCPFPFVVIDDFASPALLKGALAEWPDEKWPFWHVYQDQYAVKLASKDPSRVPPCATRLLGKMSDIPVEGWFRDNEVFPDFTLYGAGLHELKPGGYLKAHLDSEVHPSTGWVRALSGVLCVSDDWQSEWGGQLQFLDSSTKEVKQCLEMKFNRLVIFQCQGESWHQVAPITKEATSSRKTIAMFWWRKATQEELKSPRTQAHFA